MSIGQSLLQLRYLAVNTMLSAEVCDQPDSGKFGVYGSFPAAPEGAPERFCFTGAPEQPLDYRDDERLAWAWTTRPKRSRASSGAAWRATTSSRVRAVLADDDFVLECPQSAERIHGGANFACLTEYGPEPCAAPANRSRLTEPLGGIASNGGPSARNSPKIVGP